MSDPRPDVFIVIGQLEIGGTERHLVRVLSALQSNPLSCTVYALRGGGRLEREMELAGVRVLSPTHHSRRWPGLVRTAWHFVRTLRRERPRITHFFLPEAYLLGGLCSVFVASGKRVMSRRSLNAYQSGKPWAAVIEGWLHHRMDALLANSNSVLRQLIDEGAPPGKCGLIYNGIDPMELAEPEALKALRTQLEISCNGLVITKVANLIPYKGHKDLLAALAEANTKLGDEWTVLFVGDDTGVQASLEAYAETLRISSHIRWVGAVDDVAPYLQLTDIYVSASHEEGFSNAILEAMLAQTAIVATNIGGNGEAIIDGQTGLLVPPEDPAKMADAIERLAANPGERHALAKAAYVRVNEHFNANDCLRRYRALYENLLNGNDLAVQELLPGVAQADS